MISNSGHSSAVSAPNFKREIITILFIQKWIILSTAALIFAGSVLTAFFWPPEYQTSASVVVRARRPEQAPDTLSALQERLYSVTREDLASEVEILRSRPLLDETLRRMADIPMEGGPRTLRMLDQNLRTFILPSSNIIRITLRDRYPERAAGTLNTLVEAYLEYRERIYSQAGAEDFFGEQARLYREGLKELEQKMVSLAEETSVPMPSKEIESNLSIRSNLLKEQTRLRDEHIEKEMQLKHLSAALEGENFRLFSHIHSSVISQLGARLMELTAERVRTLSTYSPESERVRSLDSQMESVFKTLREEVSAYQGNLANDIETLELRMAELQNNIRALDERNLALQRQLVEMARIERESAVLEHSYGIFSRRKEEARLSEATMQSGVHSYVSLISPAPVPTDKVFPKKRTMIPFGLLVGLLSGFSLGFLREFFDHTVKRPADVETALGLPVILSLPGGKEKDSV